MERQPGKRTLRLILHPLPYTHKETKAHAFIKRGWEGVDIPLIVEPNKNTSLPDAPPKAGIVLKDKALWIFSDGSALALHQCPLQDYTTTKANPVKRKIWRAYPVIFTLPNITNLYNGMVSIDNQWLHTSKTLKKQLLKELKSIKKLPLYTRQITLNFYNKENDIRTILEPVLSGVKGTGVLSIHAPYHTENGLTPVTVKTVGDLELFPGFDTALGWVGRKIFTTPYHNPAYGHKNLGGFVLNYTPITSPSAHQILKASALAKPGGVPVDVLSF